MINKIIETKEDAIQLILRLTLGLVMFPHGAQKLFGWFGGPGISGEIKMLTGFGFPWWVPVFAIIAEGLGAIALILGLLTRISALGIFAVMLGAIFTVHLQFGFFMNWFGQKAGEGIEYHLLAIGLALPLMIRGGGLFSIDRLLQRKDV